jgi:hypothetical protein
MSTVVSKSVIDFVRKCHASPVSAEEFSLRVKSGSTLYPEMRESDAFKVVVGCAGYCT